MHTQKTMAACDAFLVFNVSSRSSSSKTSCMMLATCFCDCRLSAICAYAWLQEREERSRRFSMEVLHEGFLAAWWWCRNLTSCLHAPPSIPLSLAGCRSSGRFSAASVWPAGARGRPGTEKSLACHVRPLRGPMAPSPCLGARTASQSKSTPIATPLIEFRDGTDAVAIQAGAGRPRRAGQVRWHTARIGLLAIGPSDAAQLFPLRS